MDPNTNQQKPHGAAFELPTEHLFGKPDLTGLRQSEKDAYWFALEFLEQEDTCDYNKLKFLRAVGTLSRAVRSQTSGTMDYYLPKTVLAKKIKALILEEAGELLTSSVCQQAMICIVALSQVDPPFHLAQKLDLVSTAVSQVFSLPPIASSLDCKETASLYILTIQALDDMLQALMMDHQAPDMATLQQLLEIILPWLTMSEKEQEQTRAVRTISHMLRFICNFPELLHLTEFSINGRLMGILGFCCLDPNHGISAMASEGLHYLFKFLVLHRSGTQDTEIILKELQKHFRGEWPIYSRNFCKFFQSYLTPEERGDVIMVMMEAMAHTNESIVSAASRILKMVLWSSVPEVGKVPEIVQYIYNNMHKIPEAVARETTNVVLQLLAQTYTNTVLLVLFQMQGQSQRGFHKSWEILASLPQCYEAIMEHLLRRVTRHLRTRDREPSDGTCISLLLATRAIHELLLQPSRRMEVQKLFSPLFLALLSQITFLVVEGGTETLQDQQHVTERMDPVSCTIEALKALIRSTGYGDQVSYIQRLGGWDLLTSPERHYEGVTLLARAMVLKNCWHNRPVFGLIIKMLQDLGCRNHLLVFVFMTELLRSPDVAATVDDATIRVLASWFQCEEPAVVKLLLRVVETFARHGNMARQVRLLQPYVLNSCYSLDSDVVAETFLVLRRLVDRLSWLQSSSFLVQLTFTLGPFFEAESERLRLDAFEIYRALLAKAKMTHLVFPLKHQLLNQLVLLVLHLVDRNIAVVQACRPALCHTASILGWSRLKAVFAEGDMWMILRALLKQEAGKALWFLKQSVILFKSPQAPIRQAAVWFTGQIMQALDEDDGGEIEEACTALKSMREDPDPAVRCLAVQTLYVVEVKQKLPVKTQTSCFCHRGL